MIDSYSHLSSINPSSTHCKHTYIYILYISYKRAFICDKYENKEKRYKFIHLLKK